MADEINPYESPKSIDGIADSALAARPGSLRPLWVFFVGAVLGAVSFAAAISLTPSNVSSAGEHDLLLANHLGFIFPPLVGLWSGWVRRSWWWATGGVLIGVVIGGCYELLCGYNFLAVMVAFPCLLGGVASAAFGSGKRFWLEGVFIRFGKGLVAGFVLGFIYMVVLNGLGISWLFQGPITTEEYHRMMWHNGPVAMSLAGGVYLILFVWAANLKSFVFCNNDIQHTNT